jgi:hypothetical protein
VIQRLYTFGLARCPDCIDENYPVQITGCLP